jgi:hypothetical protein
MYGIFSVFHFYQRLHANNFSGGWVAVGRLLSLSAFVWLIFGAAFLIYWGYKISWIEALCVYASGFVFTTVAVSIEKLLGMRDLMYFISISSLIALPLLAFGMLSAIH